NSSTFSVFEIPIIFSGKLFICEFDKPIKTILISLSKISLNRKKSYKPFLLDQTLATPNIIFSLTFTFGGEKLFMSIPLLIVFTIYSFKKDCFTRFLDHLLGVTIVRFSTLRKASFLS